MSVKASRSDVTNVEVFSSGCGCPSTQPQQQPCVDVESNDLGQCHNTPLQPRGLTSGAVAKIPVVLAELRVRVHLSSAITLPEPALEVKDIKKKLKITQCLLIPAPDGCYGNDTLFIEGFVRKNIEYATIGNCSNTEGVCGDIRHCTVDVPFRCTTPIKNYCRYPEGPIKNFRKEFQYLREQNLPRNAFAEKDRLMSGDFSEFNQFSEEFFNELPFCELVKSQITEFDEFINRVRPANVTLPFEERTFREIEEKMAIAITLKILQKQQVVIPRASSQICPVPRALEEPVAIQAQECDCCNNQYEEEEEY